jgi:hypothetical protein
MIHVHWHALQSALDAVEEMNEQQLRKETALHTQTDTNNTQARNETQKQLQQACAKRFTQCYSALCIVIAVAQAVVIPTHANAHSAT